MLVHRPVIVSPSHRLLVQGKTVYFAIEMTSNIKYSTQERQESLYTFENSKYFCKMDPVLLKDENLLMRNDLDYQTIKAESQESNNPFSYSQHQYSQEQETIPARTYQNPILLTDTTQSIKAPSHDMFNSSIDTNSTSSNSTASGSSSKPLTPTDPSPDSIACGGTSNREMEDMLSSSAASVALMQCPTSVQNFPQTQPSMTFDPFQQHVSFDASPFAMHRNPSSPSHSIASASCADTQESAEDIAIRRAEQNRAAQRAFRQRKQKYIKWLESKAEELDEVYRILALVRVENQQLCNLVIELDRKLNGAHTTNVNTSISTGSVSTAGNIANQALTGKGMFGTDESIGKEISMRLMKLSTISGPRPGNSRDLAMSGKFKNRRTAASAKGNGFKGKMAYKMSQQSRHQEELLQTALQPCHMLARRQGRRSSFSTDILAISADQQLQQQNSMPWMSCPASSASPSMIGFVSNAPVSNNILSSQASTTTSVLASPQSAGNFFLPSTLTTACTNPAVYIHQLPNASEFNGALQDPRAIPSLQYSPLSKQIETLSEGNVLQHQAGIMTEASLSQQRAYPTSPPRNDGRYHQQSGIAATAYHLGSTSSSTASSPIQHGTNVYVHVSGPQQPQQSHPHPHCNSNINSDSTQQMQSANT